ncbi:helix-turn-helix domain-containing protein [Alicyclobacillus fastidiosus]|uniref:helix-turn-helix domain-containing protein n=1 Tax=Alicyclobacillus fastidiosus TaxID=392011 RepID=UPI0024E05D90|nr:helix-turn-helix domain-containing protein [Alicyclobacillus fastidiosus]
MEDVARYLRIGRASAYELAKKKDFPTIKVGRWVRVRSVSVTGSRRMPLDIIKQ